MPKGIKGSRSICSVVGCHEWAASRGLCPVHYTRVKRRGTHELPSGDGACADCGAVLKRNAMGRLAARCPSCAKERRHAQSVESHKRRPEVRRLWKDTHRGLAIVFCRPCGWCSGWATSSHRKSRFCARACKDGHHKAGLRAQILADKVALGRTCLHCGGDIDPKLRMGAAFCSETCNSAAHMLVRKMAKRSGSERNRVFRAEIAERDGWSCGICGKPVDRGLIYPDPMAPSVDHILPLALGGSNDVSNLQLSHLGCNYRKGARLLAA